MAYLGNFPAFGIFGTPNIQDFAVTPAKLSAGAPFWNSSGNVGIGTVSPGAKLEAYRNSPGEVARFTASADGFRSLKFISSDNTGSGAVWTRDIDSAYAQHRWSKSGTTLMTLNENGNLGLGVTTPFLRAVIYNPTFDTDVLAVSNPSVSGVDPSQHYVGIRLIDGYSNSDGTGNASAIRSYSNLYSGWGSDLTFWTTGSSAFGMTERGRFDRYGSFLVGSTDANGFKVKFGFTGANGLRLDTTNAAADRAIQFVYNASSEVGRIAMSTTATSYVTTSDYRLKDNPQPILGALQFVRRQRPVTYTWKADGSEAMGYIAHWMQEDGAGQCVSGEKDAVDADGNPQYQGIDTSFMVAPLNAALNELADIVDAQTERLDQQATLITELMARIATLEAA